MQPIHCAQIVANGYLKVNNSPSRGTQQRHPIRGAVAALSNLPVYSPTAVVQSGGLAYNPKQKTPLRACGAQGWGQSVSPA